MDLFSTTALNRVVEELPLNPAFFLNTFFTTVETSTTEDVKFDQVKGRRLISPLVSPIVAGKVIREAGYKTSSLSPAYVKDKRVFDPNKQFKRRAGEKIGGSLTPDQRLAASIAFALNEQLEMWTRRLEVMSAEVLRTGKVILEGDEYPKQEVDFGRDAELTIVLTGTDKWSTAAVNPLNDIEEWGQAVFDHSSLVVRDVFMASDVWKAIRAKMAGPDTDAVAKSMRLQIDTTTAGLSAARAELGPILITPGVKLVAVFGDYRLWVHADKYTDPLTGLEKDVLPAGEIVMASREIEGVRHFGAIRDLKAGIQARDFFVKSWEEEDPSVRYILGQSAPLIAPYRANGTLGAKVL
ncbi:major capsid protein [Bradyrhizobium retamae]|uniref:Phage capsid protein n=1 Tax=Bradyrhizobium retamae TaxID=1300035 RepID=A0A0R3MNH3_9BRAD|nr:major capsid protein [Bradyrhizobium retamae]KRR21703.1 phage capsid protein [Bradyrhizobium retamae]